MMLFAKIGAALMTPFLMFSGFWGFGPGAATTTPPYHSVSTTTAPWHDEHDASSTDASSTVKIRTGLWNGHPHMPIPVHATTTPSASLTLTSLSPSSGAVGTSVTITGTGFTNESIVDFGPGAVSTVNVRDNGTKLTFTIPSSVGPHCDAHMACPMFMMLVTPNAYNISVQNGTTTSNVEKFTVTGDAHSTNGLMIKAELNDK